MVVVHIVVVVFLAIDNGFSYGKQILIDTSLGHCSCCWFVIFAVVDIIIIVVVVSLFVVFVHIIFSCGQ